MSPTGVDAMVRRTLAGEVAPDHYFRGALERARSEEGKRLHAFLSLAGPEEAPAPNPPPPADGERSGPSGPSPKPAAGAVPGDGGGAPPILAGVPIAVKDNICTSDLPTTCASRILEGYAPPYEATVVRRLRAAGGRVLGKTNLDEFSMGSSTENSAYGPTLNPAAPERVPGGSSGGSASAVASGIVPCALGSDTGGSVRQPAAFCGVVGIKPTYGRVSRYGLVAFASSLDQVGTLGRTVEDAALLLQAIAGHDPRDATSSRRPPPDLRAALDAGARVPEGLTIGVPAEYFGDELEPGVRDAVERALRVLEGAGARSVAVSLPHTGYAIPAYYVLAPAEASSNLARFDGIRYGTGAPGADSTRAAYEEARSRGFGPEVVRRILLGTFVLSAGYHDRYYGRAQAARRLVARDFDRVWADGVDLLLAPTSPTPPFEFGEKADDPLSMYLSDAFTVTANLAGIPALSLPVGTAGGLPVGAQLLAPPWEEARMVRTARCLEHLLGEAGHV